MIKEIFKIKKYIFKGKTGGASEAETRIEKSQGSIF